MTVQNGKIKNPSSDINIVKQHPDPDSTVSCPKQMSGEQSSHRINMIQVKLMINTSLGSCGQNIPDDEGIESVSQRHKSRLV